MNVLRRNPRYEENQLAVLRLLAELFAYLGHFVQLRRETRFLVRQIELHQLAAGQLAVADRVEQAIDVPPRQSGHRDAPLAPRLEVVLDSIAFVVNLDYVARIDTEIVKNLIADRSLLFVLRMALIDDMQHEVRSEEHTSE